MTDQGRCGCRREDGADGGSRTPPQIEPPALSRELRPLIPEKGSLLVCGRSPVDVAVFLGFDPSTRDYQARHGLRGTSTTQKAIDALVQQELATRDAGFVRISEPFLAEWIAARYA